MKWILFAGAAVVVATPACAQDIKFKPLLEARLRMENVEQTGLATDESTAVTLRVRAGGIITRKRVSALFEAQGVLALDDHYYDGLHGAATRPLIADPENVAIHRAQLQYKDKDITVTAGRQRISLDDDRFVDAALFRQSAQTFDAVRVEWTPIPKLKADVTYAWSVRTVWGIEGTGARQRAVSGDNVFANLSYTTPIGTVTGYAYLVDQDEAAVQNFRLSNQTYGAKFAGSQTLAPKVKLNYQLSFARQTNYHRNPNSYSASYYLVDGMLEAREFRLGGGYEVLGADNGVAFTSFQMPVGSGFRWRGWAGKFVPDPADGVRDVYGTVGYVAPTLGKLKAVTLQATWHSFRSDRMDRPYGTELDLLGSAKLGRYTVSARYAGYESAGFATDTHKLWLQLDWAF
ncbi:alginate export family protein [Sphingomonas sp. LB-2]|uniref:alginate export family protein n=1 Tax=Sphingomonas caeni TaxID=2984949 RepID=UPI00222E273E|nr:alginate export family protein [Sphingomonas caeni]MCW3847402.1 alginate export family protein [Sphingomonas caeni]